MSSYASTLGLNLLAALVLMILVWLISLIRRDASIVDSFWGLGFVLLAWLTYSLTDGYGGRSLLLALLVTVWGLRLGIYITWRNWGQGEDRRYQAMRARHGDKFWLVSLGTVFTLQAVLMWIISLVVQLGQIAPQPAHFTWLDIVGVLVWYTGLIFEAGGDWQLARFKADPANKGKVMDQGFWAYTRHPNYFGETLIWWGIFLITLSTPMGVFAAISPLLITYLLLKVSGVSLLERNLTKTKPRYQDYVARTNAFFPWFARRRIVSGTEEIEDTESTTEED
jgi:steroid 5-alpha reductase family enzyme